MKAIITVAIAIAFYGCGFGFNDYQKLKDPSERFGELFKRIEMTRVFSDSKTFADAIPKISTEKILLSYNSQKNEPGFNLKEFVDLNFIIPGPIGKGYVNDSTLSISKHIDTLWSFLTRQADPEGEGSLIPLPNEYIVPGGRFREVYYWDSYFTFLGLNGSHRYALIEEMVANFAFLIDHYGHIPNGNRTYYLSRSQPPFFAAMVSLLAESQGDKTLIKYFPEIKKEYDYWMNGMDTAKPGHPMKKCVAMDRRNEILNRYCDEKSTPRPESYREDSMLVYDNHLSPSDTYRNLRSAAESGWDFSSRWLRDGKSLATIHTTDFIPVDLNCLMYNLEKTIAKCYRLKGEDADARKFNAKAADRRKSVLRYCWDDSLGVFTDYDFIGKKKSTSVTLAGMFPLFFNLATKAQAVRMATEIKKDFYLQGGVVTTRARTGQQWDAPNGWAPLEWVTVKGFINYGQDSLASAIGRAWLRTNERVYRTSGKLEEKYNVADTLIRNGGGEYPTQDGFGWSNGVYVKLHALYGNKR